MLIFFRHLMHLASSLVSFTKYCQAFDIETLKVILKKMKNQTISDKKTNLRGKMTLSFVRSLEESSEWKVK